MRVSQHLVREYRQRALPAIYERMRACFDKPGETWLCEAYAKKIRELAGDAGVLPLDPEASQQVYATWDRGTRTELYQRVEGYNTKT